MTFIVIIYPKNLPNLEFEDEYIFSLLKDYFLAKLIISYKFICLTR